MIVYKVVSMEDGQLTSVLVPVSLKISYGTVKKPKMVKECSAFKERENTMRFMLDWMPYRNKLQIWEAEAKTAKPNNPENKNSKIYDCTGLILTERIDMNAEENRQL